MTPERQDKLVEKYPKIFEYTGNKETRQPIGWGIQCGDGWFDLLDSLCACIQQEVDNISRGKSLEEVETLQVRATQVKEKFGGLRFYTTSTTDRIYGMITLAETLSYKTCETCGMSGTKRQSSWIRVSCDACEQNRTFRGIQ